MDNSGFKQQTVTECVSSLNCGGSILVGAYDIICEQRYIKHIYEDI